METVNSLWIGDSIPEVHAACLRSFIRQGYKFVLHCFTVPANVPKGVELFDASRLMRQTEIVKTELELTADIYRYRILRAGMGVYVDCDVFCLRPLPNVEILIGYEADDRANNAILKMPPESQLLHYILEASEDPHFIPPFEKKPLNLAIMKARKAMGFPVHISRQRFGSLGPRLMTYLVKKHNLQPIVQPIDVLYPLHFDAASLLHSPGLRLRDVTTPRSCTVHLFGGLLKGKPILPDTPLHDVISDRE